MLKKEIRKILCMIMTAAVVVSGTGVPASAAEPAKELCGETEPEPDFEAAVTESEEMPAPADEMIQTEPQETQEHAETNKAKRTVNWVELKDAQTVYLQGETPSLSNIWLALHETDDVYLSIKTYTTNIDKIDTSTTGVKKLTVTWESTTDANGYTWDAGSAELDLFVMEAFRDDDIANGRKNQIAYKIDKTGKLTVMGSGYISANTQESMWGKQRDSIKTAKIVIRGADTLAELLYNCSNLQSVDFSGTDTSKVKYMHSMFYGCKSLTSLDLSSFDTGKLETTNSMFEGCESLTSLNLGGFNTGNVTTMWRMFSGCKSLTGVNLGSFDTRNVTSMKEMFCGCERLASLNLSGFRNSKVTDMCAMFSGCTNLGSLNLTGFTTGAVTDMSSMFYHCENLTGLDLGSFSTGNVEKMGLMFSTCQKMTSVNLGSFHTGKVTNMSSMFWDCTALASLDLSSFDMGSVTSAGSMFMSCSALEELKTPRNVKIEISIKELCDTDGTSYKKLPMNRSDSITLKVKKEPESQKPEESSSAQESSSERESSSVQESPTEKESSSAQESASSEESSLTEESPSAGESSATEESSETEEHPSGEESSVTEESSPTEESSLTEESSKTEESSQTRESSSAQESSSSEESSATEESSRTEESSKTEESSETKGTDLNAVDGKISSVKAKTYDGNAYEPDIKVTVTQNRKKVTLTEGVDYSIEYRNNVDAGEGAVLVHGSGLYRGTLTAAFTINPRSVKSLKIYTNDTTQKNMSDEMVHIFDGAKRLENGTDYTLSYDKNLTVKGKASAKVDITGKGNYKDSKTVKVTVYDNSTETILNKVKLNKTSFRYTGKPIKSELTVTAWSADGRKLEQNKDYTVQYKNNTNAGTACVIVAGKGKCKGKVVAPFEITPIKASAANLTIAKIADKTYNGTLQKPSVNVKDGKKKLSKGKDYTLSYTNNLHASTKSRKAKVIITGKGNYAGITASAEFTINPQKISRASVKGTKDSLTVTYAKTTLQEDVHYTVKPDASSVKKNKIKIVITGLGDFAGSTVTKTVKIQ